MPDAVTDQLTEIPYLSTDDGQTVVASSLLSLANSNSVTICQDMMKLMNTMRMKGELCDMNLAVGSVVMPAHRIVVAAASNFFQHIFSVLGERATSGHMYQMPNVSTEQLGSLLDFIYTGEISLNSENIQGVLEIANKLQVRQLVSICEDFMNFIVGKQTNQTIVDTSQLESNVENPSNVIVGENNAMTVSEKDVPFLPSYVPQQAASETNQTLPHADTNELSNGNNQCETKLGAAVEMQNDQCTVEPETHEMFDNNPLVVDLDMNEEQRMDIPETRSVPVENTGNVSTEIKPEDGDLESKATTKDITGTSPEQNDELMKENSEINAEMKNKKINETEGTIIEPNQINEETERVEMERLYVGNEQESDNEADDWPDDSVINNTTDQSEPVSNETCEPKPTSVVVNKASATALVMKSKSVSLAIVSDPLSRQECDNDASIQNKKTEPKSMSKTRDAINHDINMKDESQTKSPSSEQSSLDVTASDPSNQTLKTVETIEFEIQAVTSMSPVRKRGRPRKIKPDDKTDDVMHTLEFTNKKNPTVDIVRLNMDKLQKDCKVDEKFVHSNELTPKRPKRGRPRKITTPQSDRSNIKKKIKVEAQITPSIETPHKYGTRTKSGISKPSLPRTEVLPLLANRVLSPEIKGCQNISHVSMKCEPTTDVHTDKNEKSSKPSKRMKKEPQEESSESLQNTKRDIHKSPGGGIDDEKSESVKIKKYMQVCPYCGIVKSKLREHVQLCHKEKIVQCKLCTLWFVTQELHDEHVRKSHHMMPVDGVYHCHYCSYKSKMRKYAYKHYYVMHKNKSRCKICQLDFADTKQLRDHKKAEHDIVPRHRMIVKCQHCSFETDSRHRLNIHIHENHESHITHICDQCGAVFPIRTLLNSHMRRLHHPDKKLHKCEVCNYTNEKRSNVYSHRYKVHSLLHPEHNNVYKCKKCPFSDVYQYLVKKHEDRSHLHKPPRNLLCMYCPKAFNRRSSLKYHESTHDKTTPMPFSCNACGYQCRTKGQLKKHVFYIHNDIRPFLCDTCGFATKSKGGLQKHYKHCASVMRKKMAAQQKIKTESVDALQSGEVVHAVMNEPEQSLVANDDADASLSESKVLISGQVDMPTVAEDDSGLHIVQDGSIDVATDIVMETVLLQEGSEVALIEDQNNDNNVIRYVIVNNPQGP